MAVTVGETAFESPPEESKAAEHVLVGEISFEVKSAIVLGPTCLSNGTAIDFPGHRTYFSIGERKPYVGTDPVGLGLTAVV